MKLKAILALGVLLFSTQAARAADDMRYGVLGGLDFTKLSGDISSGSTTGFLAGVFAQYPVTAQLYVEPQLRYIQKGGDYSNIAYSDTIDANYLEVPVYAKYKFTTGTMILPYVFAGPSFGFKVGSGSTREFASGAPRVESDGGVKFFDLGLDLGVGGELAMTDRTNVGLSAAYNFGLLDMLDGPASAHNRGFQIYAQVSFLY